MWTFLEIGNHINWAHKGDFLIQYEWCLYKTGKFEWTYIEEDDVETGRRWLFTSQVLMHLLETRQDAWSRFLPSHFRENMAVHIPSFTLVTSISVTQYIAIALSHLVLGTLWQQTQETDIPYMVTKFLIDQLFLNFYFKLI